MTTPIEPPFVLSDAAEVVWDHEADIVVVGFGSSGANAALTAHEEGAEVIVLDRFAGGGATRWSGGVIYGGGTRFQATAGVQDDAANMYAYLSQEKMSVRPETLRRFCDESGPQIDWLAGHGVQYDATLYPDPVSFPPDGHHLYYSGNETHPRYREKARPAPRGHRPVGKGPGGVYYFTALRRSVEAKGIRVMPHAPVRRLVVDASGVVIGVEILAIPTGEQAAHAAIDAKLVPLSPMTAGRADGLVAQARAFEARFAGRRLIRARSGVILAAGGFIYDAERLDRYGPAIGRSRRSVMRLGSLGDDGSGIDLGRSVGGDVDYMDSFFVGRSLAPPAALLRGVLVNKHAERFASEDLLGPFLGMEMAKQPDGAAWLILDDETYRIARRQALFPAKGMRLYTLPTLLAMILGGTRKAKSLAALAGRIGVPADGLVRTVDRARAQWAKGEDDFGKTADNIAPFGDGPFHALNVGIGYKFAPTMAFSMGGLRIDETSGEVLRGDGTTIPHLYAAGRTAVGVMSAADVMGMSIADTVFSGRRAGRHAARAINARAGMAGRGGT